jgi:hypothetical protein
MTREQLEHIIRASGSITDEKVLLILGSQSILGAIPEPPPELCLSTEADICPIRTPDKIDLISGSIGELSHFQETFGYYAHGLPPNACALPIDWEKRLIEISNPNTNGFVGLCLAPLDMACAKLAAGREKDIEFVQAMLTHRLLDLDQLSSRSQDIPTEEQRTAASRNLAILRGRNRTMRSLREPEIPTDEHPKWG